MNNNPWYAFFCLMLLLFSGTSLAVEVPDLFEIELVARSESSEDRLMAVKQGLFAVLDRVVIADDIAKIPAIQDLLLNAQNYVKQSQYALLPADANADSSLRKFRVQFDENQVLEQLRKAQLGIWTEIRPETLLWLVVESDGVREFYNADDMPEIENALTVTAKMKAIPLIFPLLDLEEQKRISINDVLGTDTRNLLALSSRYDVPAIMTGRLLSKENCWQSEWSFYFDGKIKQWHSDCVSLRPAINVGIKGAYSILASYYGLKPETPIVPAQQ